jgi:hypothetical protein
MRLAACTSPRRRREDDGGGKRIIIIIVVKEMRGKLLVSRVCVYMSHKGGI